MHVPTCGRLRGKHSVTRGVWPITTPVSHAAQDDDRHAEQVIHCPEESRRTSHSGTGSVRGEARCKFDSTESPYTDPRLQGSAYASEGANNRLDGLALSHCPPSNTEYNDYIGWREVESVHQTLPNWSRVDHCSGPLGLAVAARARSHSPIIGRRLSSEDSTRIATEDPGADGTHKVRGALERRPEV